MLIDVIVARWPNLPQVPLALRVVLWLVVLVAPGGFLLLPLMLGLRTQAKRTEADSGVQVVAGTSATGAAAQPGASLAQA